MKSVIGYWGKREFVEYVLEGERVTEDKKTLLEQLEEGSRKGRRRFTKRYLVVSRENLILLKRIYPKSEPEKLRKVIELDLMGIGYGKDEWNFYYRTFEVKGEKLWTHVWLWSKREINKVVAYFRPSFIIPEDLCFVAETPNIFIVQVDETRLYAVAVKKRVFYSSSIFSDEEDLIEKFPLLMAHFEGEECFVENYSNVDNRVLESFGVKLKEVSLPPVPLSVWQLSRSLIETKTKYDDFKISKGVFELVHVSPLVGLNIIMILVLAFGINLYVRNTYLKRFYREKKDKIRKEFNEASVVLERRRELEKKRELIKNAAVEISQNRDFLKIIQVIYQILPKDAYLNGLSVEKEKVELKIKAKNPVNVLWKFNENRFWWNVKIQGPLVYKRDGYTEFVVQGDIFLSKKEGKGVHKAR